MLTNETTRTCRKGTTLIINIINRFTEIFTALPFFTIVLLQRHLRPRLIMESRQVIGFLITLSCTDVVRHTGRTERTVTND